MKVIQISSIFLMAVLAATPVRAELTGRASVIDGDTFEIRNERIRLHGVDAPESSQLCKKNGRSYQCGSQAAQALDNLLLNKTVRCDKKDMDRYGRTVAECFAGVININAWLVENGWALAYREYSSAYIPQEKIARQNKAGIWAGSFENPWDYRRGPTEEEKRVSKGCLIKGNINSKGRKIYHLPGTSTYGRTRIDKDKGERWFCTEADARKSGWVSINP